MWWPTSRAHHEALGWNPDTGIGSSTGSFIDVALGRSFAQGQVDQGADILFPVAGPVSKDEIDQLRVGIIDGSIVPGARGKAAPAGWSA